jgi:hypothetical protein
VVERKGAGQIISISSEWWIKEQASGLYVGSITDDEIAKTPTDLYPEDYGLSKIIRHEFSKSSNHLDN